MNWECPNHAILKNKPTTRIIIISLIIAKSIIAQCGIWTSREKKKKLVEIYSEGGWFKIHQTQAQHTSCHWNALFKSFSTFSWSSNIIV